MKNRIIIALCAILLASGMAQADVGIAYVGTANAPGAYDVQNSGNQLYYHPQPDTDYVWMNNNGDPPGTVATSGGFNRDGMKTFAATDIAYGQSLNTIQMAFDYNTGADPTTGLSMGGVAINFFLTDGNGHYGIWSATSGAALYTDTDIGGGWMRRALDCTSIADAASVAVYEHNGFSNEYNEPYTSFDWSVLKNFTIAGFYDYQRTPEGGFESWSTMWSDITNVTDPMTDTTLNEYGITLNWGDTVGGTSVDGSGEIGLAADRAYGQAGRLIKDYDLTVGGTAYDMSFEATQVPVPGAVLLGAMGLGMVGWMKRRKQQKA